MLLACLLAAGAECLNQKEHRTAAAAERANDLRCYVCESLDPLYGHSCVHAPHSLKQFEKRCRDDARICMVSCSYRCMAYWQRHWFERKRGEGRWFLYYNPRCGIIDRKEGPDINSLCR